MQLHDLKRNPKKRFKKTVGRGGKRGTTSGRGTKGQKARAGHRMRPELRDIIKKLPKKRGYRFFSSNPDKPQVVNLDKINPKFAAGATVTPGLLVKQGLVTRVKGSVLKVKVLGGGALDRALKFKGFTFAESAKTKIKAAGGEIK